MTVQNTIVKNMYQGNGSTTVFPYTFALHEDDGEYVQVYVTTLAGAELQTTDFTIDTDARTVTYPATAGGDPLPAGCKIALLRVIPATQELNLENQGAFFAEDIEAELDRIVMMVQQIKEVSDRCIKAGPTSALDLTEVTVNEIYAGRDAALAAAAAAADSRTAAGLSAASAATSAATATTKAGEASTSAGTATTAAQTATAKADIAAASANSVIALADTARGYAQAAGDSATSASTSAGGAQHWANLAHDYAEPLRQAVVAGMFEYDANADLQLCANPLAAASTMWETDTNGDVMPVA